MAAWEVALLLSWLSCCGSALWRYYTRSPSYAIFSIRSTIKLEYEGTDFSEWIVPETCSIQDKRSPRTELRCSSPGFQAIRPVVTGPEEEEERNLFVTESHICFFWYFTIKNLFVNFTQLITIWVYDPENAGPDELLMTAEEPSLNSLVLSKQLAILGQKPTIYTFLQKNVYYSYESHRKGIWHMIIPMTSDDVIKEIKGNQVVFQDCFIADGLFLMTFPTSTIPEHPAFLPLSSPPGSQIISTWVACIPSSVVVVTEMETFQTLDSFRTWSKVRVPPNVLSDSERHNVSKVELSSDGIFFLINGVLYLRNSYLLMKLGREHNLPDEIIGIRARKWCWVKYIFKNEVEKSSLIIWTKDEVYLGYTKLKFIQIGTISKLKSLVNMSPTATLTIHNAEYTGHPVEFAVFLSYCTACTVTKRIYTVIYNEDLREWIYQDFKLDVPVNSFLVPYFLFSAMPEVVLSDGHRIYYCYQNFTVCGIIQTATGSSNLLLLSNNSVIHDIFMDYYGNILVKMENNVIFFFKIYSIDTIKLHTWLSEKIKSLFLLSTSGEIHLLEALDNGTIKTAEYPLSLEIQSVAFKAKDTCPFLAFHNNVYNMFYIIDKRDVLKVWAKVVYPENTGVYILVETYGPRILTINEYLFYEIALGFFTKTLLLGFSQSINYEAAEDYFKLQNENTGAVFVNLRPSKYSKACTASQKVFQIAVGCDISKFIRVKGFHKKNCLHHDFSYVIDKSYLRDRPSKNLKVRYAWELYGCPKRLNFTEKFQPVIQLFNENGFIENIVVNFIIWEIHGRDDYSFANTMKQSGCLNEAQTWKSMTTLNNHLPLEEAWGPENYRHCFSYAIGKPGDLDQPYEIINSTNGNHLVWPSDHSGLYVFRVKILDPNYSFCNLTATFAIETYGAIPRPSGYLVAAFIFSLMLLFCSILVLSYFSYLTIYKQCVYDPLHKPQRKSKKK